MSFNGESPASPATPTLDDVRAVLERDGHHPVLLYIDKGSKRPSYSSWEKTTYEKTQTASYRRFLERHSNTGVLLGVSDDLCTIDCDTESYMAAMIELNPAFASTLISAGERAGQFWIYVTGARPHRIEYLKVRKDSPLALGAKKIEPDGTVKVGELRAEGGQSVIRGIHPCGCVYRWLCGGPIVTVDFAQINWPGDVIIPWGKDRRSGQSTTGNAADDSLLKRAIEALSVDRLWDYFNYPARSRNPVCSPFREDRSPSFSVYDEGRRWKDHGTGEHGDSYDFYQRATGLDARGAFVSFVELAGFGHELKKNQNQKKSRSEMSTEAADPGVTPEQSAKSGTEGPGAEGEAVIRKPALILPSGFVTFSGCAEHLFPVLAQQTRYFVRDRLLVEVAYQKMLKDKQLHDVFQPLEPDALRSRIEKHFRCQVWREERGDYVKKPGRCTSDAAKVLLKTDAAFEHLPAISFLSAQPVYTVVDGELEILYRGYYEVHGGVYVSRGEKDHPIVLPDLETAVNLILGALKDYDFVSPSDKSRAVASFISPALRVGKFLGDADFPIDIAEANESQGGKTYRLKLICAVYGETPYIIANREGGVGSLDESISSALVAGIPFILFENFRGRMNSQPVETCLRGTGVAPARIPHRGEVQVSTGHINWQLSSNGLEATNDFVNRAIINRNSKKPVGFEFTKYDEGDILGHIKAKQPEYLGAVFRIIKEWFDKGKKRTDENRHDFREWVQTLDWIVKNIFKLPALVDGHVEEVLRVSDPALSWLRQVAIAVEKENRLGLKLAASDLVDICQARGIEFPNKIFNNTNLEQLAMYTGRLLARIFRDLSVGEKLSIDRYEIRHESCKQYRSPALGGDFFKQFYWFKRRGKSDQESG